MPLPRVIARLNKRYTNWLIEPIVRRTPGFAVVEHVGRRTGAAYRTPVYAFRGDADVFVALTYGPSADWVQNVLAGGSTIQRSGRNQAITSALVVRREEAWKHLPRFVRVALRIFQVRDFLRIDTADPVGS